MVTVFIILHLCVLFPFCDAYLSPIILSEIAIPSKECLASSVPLFSLTSPFSPISVWDAYICEFMFTCAYPCVGQRTYLVVVLSQEPYTVGLFVRKFVTKLGFTEYTRLVLG